MERTILPNDEILCPLVKLKRRSVNYCTHPCEYFIKKIDGVWYSIIRCSKTEEVYEEAYNATTSD